MKAFILRRMAAAPALRILAAWFLFSLGLHLLWEIAQLPLYTLWREAGPGAIAWAVIHCTAGDGMIAAATYLLAGAWAGGPRWPWRALGRGLPVLLASGIAYTAFSEWRNVQVLGAWAYAEAMPTVLGIGLAPLLQWVVVPALALAGLRRWPEQAWRKDFGGEDGHL